MLDSFMDHLSVYLRGSNADADHGLGSPVLDRPLNMALHREFRG